MKQNTTLILAAILAFALAGGLSFRSYLQKQHFDTTVEEALKTSQGYDEQFVNMVNRLEDELAFRASFGYKGGKDPMTGKIRRVVTQPPAKASRRRGKNVAATASMEERDPVKLTAIIFDDENRKFTAIVMDGERSFSVEVGDRIRDRQVVKITDEYVLMENSNIRYMYNIYGQKAQKKK